MNKNYEYIFLQCADSWEKVTPSIVELMFERAENMDYKLNPFKEWLMKQPMTTYTKDRVNAIYMNFLS